MHLQILSGSEGDWDGVYIDGELYLEGDSIDWAWFIETNLVGQTIESFQKAEMELWELGNCPATWQEVLDAIGTKTPEA